MIEICTQAVSATRDLNSGPANAPPVVPAGSVTGLLEADPAVASVRQVYASEGGQPAEEGQAFRVRISERLRHKKRAIEAGDYARMVLAEFPEIGDARAFHAETGRVDVVVMPKRSTAGKTTAPVVSLILRYRISQWLLRYTSIWTRRVIVRNPVFETVRARAAIVKNREASNAAASIVEDELDRLIAPWLFDLEAPVPIGAGDIDLGDVGSRIEQLTCVDQVEGLSITHVFRLREGADAGRRYGLKDTARSLDPMVALAGARLPRGHAVIKPAHAWSVLFPANDHRISYLGDRRSLGELHVFRDLVVPDPALQEAYLKGNAPIPLRPMHAGIGNLAIGEDMVITTNADATPPSRPIDTSLHGIDRVFMQASGLETHDSEKN